MSLDPNDPRPTYQQIADDFRRSIQAGEYKPGDQLPSLTELVESYQASKSTVQAAIRALRASGLIVAKQGKGIFVRTDAASATEEPLDSAVVMRQLDSILDHLEKLENRMTTLEAAQKKRRAG